MRDIRGDLEERAAWLEKQISSAQAHFDMLVERFKAEHENRLKPVRAEFDAVHVLLGGEDRRLGSGATALKPQASAQGPQQAKLEQAQPAQQPQGKSPAQPASKPAPSPSQQPLVSEADGGLSLQACSRKLRRRAILTDSSRARKSGISISVSRSAGT